MQKWLNGRLKASRGSGAGYTAPASVEEPFHPYLCGQVADDGGYGTSWEYIPDLHDASWNPTTTTTANSTPLSYGWYGWYGLPPSRSRSTMTTLSYTHYQQPSSPSSDYYRSQSPTGESYYYAPRDSVRMSRTASFARTTSSSSTIGAPAIWEVSTGEDSPSSEPTSVSGYSSTLDDTFANDSQGLSENSPVGRPRSWREGYIARDGLESLSPVSLGARRSDVAELPPDPTRRTVHRLLTFTHADPAIHWDLRQPLDETTLTLLFPSRGWDHIDLARPATDPPTNRMRLVHEKLPWYIGIRVRSKRKPLTIRDVLLQTHEQLRTAIEASDYYNDEMSERGRAVVQDAFEKRCAGVAGAKRRRGVLRVDYLEGSYIFVGLTRCSSGMWEMKLRRGP